ncbi:MAG: hypothetical protein MUC60_05790 [Oscillatoria sp. Prado101]|nr:hypothetical protein [Oscillatoria sp. Prado101]
MVSAYSDLRAKNQHAPDCRQGESRWRWSWPRADSTTSGQFFLADRRQIHTTRRCWGKALALRARTGFGHF